MRPFHFAAIVLIAVAACSSPAATSDAADLPPTSPEHMRELLATSEQPVVLNVWASWCVPCRSEAPLLAAAHAEFSNEVLFVGVDVGDTHANANAFLEEFDIEFENYFDRDATIRTDLGGIGVPVTYFISAGGTNIVRHNGVIDERTLVLGIDELLNAN